MRTVQQPPQAAPIAGLWPLFRVWAGIGLQSFGGGASTIFLIQREFLEKRQWLTPEEFAHCWSLCMMAPGINLVALTILIGRKIGGGGGVIASLLGMLLPSVTITCLITAVFKGIEHLPATQAALDGIIPATGGIMLLVGLNFALPQARQARREGVPTMIICALLVLGSLLAIVRFDLPAALILPGAGVLGILCFTYLLKQRPGKEKQDD